MFVCNLIPNTWIFPVTTDSFNYFPTHSYNKTSIESIITIYILSRKIIGVTRRQCFNVYLNYFVIIIINGMTISVFHLCYVLLCPYFMLKIDWNLLMLLHNYVKKLLSLSVSFFSSSFFSFRWCNGCSFVSILW